jgi:predicted permease
MLFVQIILPVFLIILAGYILEKRTDLPLGPLSDVSLYLFSPCLVFSALVAREISFAMASDLFLFMILYTAVLLAMAYLTGRLLKMEGDARGALCLGTAMMNVGNFGLPLAYFAFGDRGLEASILIFVMFNLSLGTVAIMIAQGSKAPLGRVLLNTCKIPIFHAVLLAFCLKYLGWEIPEFLLRAITLLGQAAIPLMLVLLGMQLARTRLQGNTGFISVSVLLRLLLAPLVAWGITTLLGIKGLTRDVVILQTSTPSAVLPLLYCLRFNTRPDLLAGAIFATTMLSALSLTVILYLQQ